MAGFEKARFSWSYRTKLILTLIGFPRFKRANYILRLECLGRPGEAILDELRAGGSRQLAIMLGRVPSAPPTEDSGLRRRWGKALWCYDRNLKNYIVAVWRFRKLLVGDLNIEKGLLVTRPTKLAGFSGRAAVDEALRRQGDTPKHALCNWLACKQFWSPWVPLAPPKWGWKKSVARGRKSAFYVVWAGRKRGLFYLWSDTLRSVANFEDAVFKGFATLAEAEEVEYDVVRC